MPEPDVSRPEPARQPAAKHARMGSARSCAPKCHLFPPRNPGLLKRMLATVVCIGSLWLATAGAQAGQRQAGTQPDYLAIVKAYANAMITKGRDVYGSVHSPLFASALDRRTMQIGSFGNIPGVRNGDRSLGGANPQVDADLYAILYRLTTLTGEQRYADEADRALKFFFSHCQSPKTGLMAWGEHLYWDFRREAPGGDDSKHEICGEWPFWDQCYRLAPRACWRFAIGLWDHQVADKTTGDFSRHARWSRHGPQRGAEFPRYAGQMIATWTDAYLRKENRSMPRRPELVTAIAVVVGRMENNLKKSPTGYLPAGSDKIHRRISWPSHNLELARCLWNSAPHMNGELARRMKKLALRMDHDFFRMPHTISSSGGGFVATIDTITGKPRIRLMGSGLKNLPYTTTWEVNYGQKTHARMANRCYQRFKQLETTHPDLARKYQQMILSAADLYLRTKPDPNALVKPKAVAEVITLLLNAWNITGNRKYLDRADYFGRMGIELFLDDGLPLPKATNRHDHYESITGGPFFMHTLLKLYEAKNNLGRPRD